MQHRHNSCKLHEELDVLATAPQLPSCVSTQESLYSCLLLPRVCNVGQFRHSTIGTICSVYVMSCMVELKVQVGNRKSVLEQNLQDVFFPEVAVFSSSRANAEGLIC